MISYLKVRNLAIVEELAIEPGPGLNVLTGETGAGKSLLIDSLEFLSGARGTADLVRTGADRMTAEAVFNLPASAKGLLEERAIDFEIVDRHVELVVRREMTSAGRGRVSVNGSTLTVRELQPVMECAIEIHGQDESRGRVAGQSYIEMLDSFAGNRERLDNCRAAYAEWRRLNEELRELTEAHRDRALKVDLLKYQIDEISAAAPRVEEEDQLRNERAVLGNAQALIAAAAAAYALIEEDEFSAAEQLGRAAQHLTGLARSVDEIRQLHDELDELRSRAREVGRALSRIGDTVHDPARLEEVEERLATFDRLKKKYGGSIEAALEHLEKITREYDQLNDFESHSAALEASVHKAFEKYRRSAVELSTTRHAAAAALQEEIRRELLDLAMERTEVRIAIATTPHSGSELDVDGHPVRFGPDGYDTVDVLIAPNLGDEPRPLDRIASGGELSRLQLAIATALFRNSDRAASATLVFDEVDAGVGGRVAEAVGRKLVSLAERNQVICVTHLPQIAAMGSTHFHVWKEDVAGRTRARISALSSDGERVEEIARMLAGQNVTDSARAHAAELIDQARSDARATTPGKRKSAPRVRTV